MEDKKILVVGLGKEGVSAANYLSANNKVSVYDDKSVDEIDGDFVSRIPANVEKYLGIPIPTSKNFDIIIRSPGVQTTHSVLKQFNQAHLSSVTKIFFDECPGIIIGITGTKGKGTTSTLIYEILKRAGKDVYLGGNIGNSPLDFLSELKPDSLVVLELSSFQLMDLDVSPHVGVVLMVTSEHLNWHRDLEDYVEAKSAIVANQVESDYAVVNADYPNSKKIGEKSGGKIFFFSTKEKVEGSYLDGDKIMSEGQEIADISDILLPGRHNLQNVLAAVTVAQILKISKEDIVSTLQTFKGLAHRLELVAEVLGVKFYDDSFSTTPETTIAAIEAFDNPKVLILGGSSKNSDFSQLANKIHSSTSVKAIILIGDEAGVIKSAIESAGGTGAKQIEGLSNMSSIVKTAVEVSRKGDVVLLTPACASFGMFKNYIDRGNQFREEVKKIKK